MSISFKLDGFTAEQYLVEYDKEFYKFLCINSGVTTSYILVRLDKNLNTRYSDTPILSGRVINDEFVREYFKDYNAKLVEIEGFTAKYTYKVKEQGYNCMPGMDFTHTYKGKSRHVKLMEHNEKSMRFHFMDTGLTVENTTYPVDRFFSDEELKKMNLALGMPKK